MAVNGGSPEEGHAMLEVETVDELERLVTIAELEAETVEAAFYPDPAVLASAEKLERTIINILEAQCARPLSSVVPRLFAYKIRLGAALDQMREVDRSRYGDASTFPSSFAKVRTVSLA
jgi:hypothetical protein